MTSMPLELSTKRVAAALPLIEALEMCSVPRAMWHLSAGERWAVVRDTLLGHAPLRGGLRPRDLPIDHECREMLRKVAAFHTLQPDLGGRAMSYRFGDWLYAFAVLVQPLLCQKETSDEPPAAHQAVYQCFLEIRRVLPVRVSPDDAPWPAERGDLAKSCPILHRLIGTVGWSIKDWNHLRTHANKPDPWQSTGIRSVKACADIARLTARIAERRGNPEGLNGNDRRLLQELERKDLRLMTAMTKSVQDYLCRGRRHWLMRGASAWSAQALAFARDTIATKVSESLLLSDSDVVVTFLVPADTKIDACQVISTLWEQWQNKETFLDRFPRLRELPDVASSNDLDPRLAFPAISIRLSKPTSLLDLCTPGESSARLERDFDSAAVRGGHGMETKGTATPCTYVSEDVAITSQPPPWMEIPGNNDHRQVKKDEKFGFTSLVWSLCGTTLRAHWFQNVARDNATLAPAMRMMPVHHGLWLKWLHAESEPLVFLKLDGDAVGRTFTNEPIPRRPYLSMELGRLVLKRVHNATRAVIEQRAALTDERVGQLSDEDKRTAESKGVSLAGHDNPLPADMVYVGGDDIFFCLPESSVATFLAGFTGPVADDYPEQWRTLRFKFVSVTLPIPVSIAGEIPEEPILDPKTGRMGVHPQSNLMQIANLWAAQLAGDTLKEVAKADRGEQAQVLEKLKAGWENPYGFDCEIWEPELKPYSGAIDETVVHGVHVRLIPKPA